MGLSGGDKLVKGLTNHHSLLSYHIEYNEKEGLWKKTDVKQSPKLLVRLQVAARDYEEFRAEILWEVDKPLTCVEIADTGVQIDVINWATLKAMNINESELLSVPYGIGSVVRGSQINVKGGVLLRVLAKAHQGERMKDISIVRLFYVAENCM